MSQNYPGLYARAESGTPVRAKSFLVETVFMNGQWESGREIGFHEMIIQFRHLGYWSPYDSFDLDFHGSTGEATLRVKSPEEITLYLDDHFRMDLFNWAPESQNHEMSDSRITFRREALIRIKADKERPYKCYIPHIETIQSFLCFCLGCAIVPEKRQGFSTVHTLSNSDHSPSSALPIDICTVAFRRHQADQLLDKKLVRAPLSLEDLGDQIPQVIERWKTIQETFRIPWMLLLSTLFNQQMYLEHQFLSRCQCIEIYHRTSANYLDTLQDPTENDNRLELVKTALKEHTPLRSQTRRMFISKL